MYGALVGVADRDAGVASALVNTAQQVGGSLGTVLLNTIATNTAAGNVTAHAAGLAAPALRAAAVAHGYSTAFGVSTALLAVAVLSSAILVRRA